MLSAILTAFNFLTILHIPTKAPSKLSDFGRAVGWFPLVGLVLGALLTGIDWGLRLMLPPGPSAVLVIALWLVASGGIHFDGLLDSADGLLGGKTPLRRLEIMRDHRVGAFATAAGGLLLLAKYSTLTAMADRRVALLLAPMLGRWMMTLAIVFFPYAREQGLGRALKDYANNKQVLLATALTVPIVWLVGGNIGLSAWAATGVFLFITARFIQTRIPGLTGDSYGALCELGETLALFVFVAKF